MENWIRSKLNSLGRNVRMALLALQLGVSEFFGANLNKNITSLMNPIRMRSPIEYITNLCSVI